MTNRASWKKCLGAALMALLVHYLALGVAYLLQGGMPSWSGFGQLLADRLMTAGDSPHYLEIAQNGYQAAGETANNLVFYPLYPLLCRVLSPLFQGNIALTGVVLSQGCYAGSAAVLYQLIFAEGGDDARASFGVALYALYPFSVFTMGVFTEGLFLLLTLLTLWWIRRHAWICVGCVGFLAALTRIQGVILLLPAGYELLTQGRQDAKRARQSAVLLIPLGFLVYLALNYALHHNAFQFLVYEKDAPWYQTTRWIADNIAQHYAMSAEYEGLALIIYDVQIVLYFAILGTLGYGLWKKTRAMYVVYGGAYLCVSYLSGWMISGGRYMLGCVPVFLILSGIPEAWARRLLLVAASGLFIVYTVMYMHGYAIM